MDQQFEPPHSNGAVTINEPPQRRRRIPRHVIVALLLVVCAAWGYAIWYSVTRTSPEDLDDAARADIGAACTAALEELQALPVFDAETTAAEGVTLVAQENEIFSRMIDRAAAVDVDAGGDAEVALESWTEDWRALVQARAEFADDLADDGSARLQTPSIRSGSVRPISDRMNEYALQRGLDDCSPDALQAEVVDGPRDYTQEV